MTTITHWPPSELPPEGYGNVLGFVNIDPVWNIEIQRAPDDGTGSPDTANAEIIDVVNGNTEKYVDFRDAGSGPWHYRWRTNLSGCSAGSWTDWLALEPVDLGEVLPSQPDIPDVLVVDWTAVNASRNSADARLVLFDPELRLSTVEYNKRPGGNNSFSGWTSWSPSTGTIGTDQIIILEETVSFHEKHNSKIKARFEYDKVDGAGTRTRELQVLTFDVDDTAEMGSFVLSVEPDGSVYFDAAGDDDVATIYGRFQTGSPPADPDGTESDTTAGEVVVSASSVTNKDTGLDISSGETVYGKIRGENSAGDLGPVLSGQFAFGGGGAIPPTVDLEYVSSDVSWDYDSTNVEWTAEVTMTIEASSEFTGSSLEVRYRVDDVNGTGSWSSWFSAPKDVTIEWTDDDPSKELVVQARDTAQSSSPTSASLSKSLSGVTEPQIADHKVMATTEGKIRSRTKVSPRAIGGKIHMNIATGQDPSASDPPADGTADKVIDLGTDQQEATASWSQILSKGDEVEIAARAEDPNGNPGAPKSIVRDESTREDANPVTVDISEDRTAGNATASVKVTGPGSYDIEIFEILADGTSTSLVSNTGVTDGGTNDPTSVTRDLNESRNLILRVVVKDNNTGDVLRDKSDTFDEDKVPDTTLGVAVSDDGTPTAYGRADNDAEGGVIHLEQAVGSDPTASDPDGTEDTVNLSSGQRLWRHTFSSVTVDPGQEISVKARAESSDGVLAGTARIVEAKDTRASGSEPTGGQNFFNTDAGPEHSGTSSTFYTYLDSSTLLSNLELEVGDVISLSSQVKSETGADRVRIELEFYDSSDTLLDSFTGNSVTSSSYAVSEIENITIPSNTSYMVVGVVNQDTTETAYSRRAMLNHGPVSLDYEPPPIRRERSGQIVEAGQVRNPNDDAGVLLSGTVPSAWNQYLNLDDSNSPFLKHGSLQLNQDGSADFSGTVSSDKFTADLITQGDTSSEAIVLKTAEAIGGDNVPQIEMTEDGSVQGSLTGLNGIMTLGTDTSLTTSRLEVDPTFGVRIEDSSGNGNDNLQVDGNVGIGVSPSAPLDVNGNAIVSQIGLKGTTPGFAMDTVVGDTAIQTVWDSDRAGSDEVIVNMVARWNGNNVAKTEYLTGPDTTNHDDGQIIFSTASGGTMAEAVRIDESGNLGIGTTAPSEKLHTSGYLRADGGPPADGQTLQWNDSNNRYEPSNAGTPGGSDGDLQYNNGGSFGGGPFWDDTNARLGIRTTSPVEALHISGASAHSLFSADSGAIPDNGSLNSPYLRLRGYYDADSSTSTNATPLHVTIQNIVDYNGSSGAHRLAFKNDAGTEFVTFDGDDERVGIGATSPSGSLDVNSGYTYLDGLRLGGSDTGNTIYNGNNDLALTRDHTSGGTEGVKVTSSDVLLAYQGKANVGIGTTSPSHNLTVNDGTAPVIGLTDGTQTWTTAYASGQSYWRLRDNSGGNDVFAVENSAPANSLYITSGGNVGVSTSSPGTAFEVSGSIKSTNSVIADHLDLNNHEQGDFSGTGGHVYHDESAGLYVTSSNVGGSDGALLWSSDNFDAGSGINVSYNAEDHPTLSVNQYGNLARTDLNETLTGEWSLPALQLNSAAGKAEIVNGFSGTVNTTGEWIRIAEEGPTADTTSGGSRAMGYFTVHDQSGGEHRHVTFHVKSIYGGDPQIVLVSGGTFSGSGIFEKIRVVSGDTYEGSAVEIYVPDTGGSDETIYVEIQDNFTHNGYSLTTSLPSGNVWTGATVTQLDLDSNEPLMAATSNGNNDQFMFKNNGDAHIRGSLAIGGTAQNYTLDVHGGFQSDGPAGIIDNVASHVVLDGSPGDIRLRVGGSDALRVLNSNGNVGIGTSSPNETLHSTGRARVEADGSVHSAGTWYENSANDQNWFIGLADDTSTAAFRFYRGGDHLKIYNSGVTQVLTGASGSGPNSDGAVRNIVHHGTNSASAVGIEGTLHTENL